jgi:hypothetical protein
LCCCCALAFAMMSAGPAITELITQMQPSVP